MYSRRVSGVRSAQRTLLPSSFLLPSILLTSSSFFPSAHAYRRYLSYLPNSDLVPCTTEASTGQQMIGCQGTNKCEAFGHEHCQTDARVTPAGAMLGNAGATMQAEKGKGGGGSGLAPTFKGWSPTLCAQDSDFDASSNGDELGDGCCAWPVYPPLTTDDISNPGFDTSTTSRISCTGGGVPPAPTGVSVTSTCGAGCASIQWDPAPALTVACICEWKVDVVSGSTTLSTGVFSSQTQAKFCNLPPGGSITVSVYALNRAGSSPVQAGGAITATAGSGGSGTPSGCTTLEASPIYIDASSRATVDSYVKYPNALGGVVWFAVVGLIIALGGCIVGCFTDTSCCRRTFVHRYMYAPIPSGSVSSSSSSGASAGASSPSLLKRSSTFVSDLLNLKDLGESSLGLPVSLFAMLVALAACTYATFQYYDVMVFPLNTKAAIGRALGYTLAGSMGLQLLPVTRFSIWPRILGISFERALKFHRWAGMATLGLAAAHGIVLAVVYSSSPLGLTFLGKWLSSEVVNPLAGLLSGVCMLVLTLLSSDQIRRKAYELFLLGHMLWIPSFILAIVHLNGSDSKVIPFFLPPVALLVIDVGFLLSDMFFVRPAVLIDAGLLMKDGRVISCGYQQQSDTKNILGGGGVGGGDTIVSADPIAPSGAATLTPTSVSAADVATLHAALCDESVGVFFVIDKLPAAFGWAFRYSPGQNVYLSFPSVSQFPHPITISSVPYPDTHPGRFTVHIKSMGKNTWSGKLITVVAKAVAARIALSSSSSSSSSSQATTTAPQGKSTNDNASSSLTYENYSNISARLFNKNITTSMNNDNNNAAAAAAVTMTNGNTTTRVYPSTGNSNNNYNASTTSFLGTHAYGLPQAGKYLPGPAVTASARDVLSWPIHYCYHAAQQNTTSLLNIHISGPFGTPSVALPQYSHFLLAAGGIGITPIAALHSALVQGLPLEGGLADHSWSQAMGASIRDSLSGRKKSREASSSSSLREEKTCLRTLTTVWSVREESLITAFAPMLVANTSTTTASASSSAGSTTIRSTGTTSTSAGIVAEVDVLEDDDLESGGGAGAMTTGGGGRRKMGGEGYHDAPTPTPTPTITTPGVRSSPVPSSPSTGQITTNVHCTTMAKKKNTATATSSSAASTSASPYPWPIQHTRPHWPDVFEKAAREAVEAELCTGENNTSLPSTVAVAVVVCGPGEMVTSVIAHAQLASSKLYTVEYNGKKVVAQVVFNVHRETFLM